MDCHNSRGLLVSDHLAKAFIGQLKNEIEPAYARNMPESQCGGVAVGGTEYAHHTITTCIDYAKIMGMSIFVLFLDLEKAFDKVVREIVLGWPQNISVAPIEYLLGLGLPSDAAQWLCEYIRQFGSVFHQWQLDEKVQALINSLHTHSWFQYSILESVISTNTGGHWGPSGV